MTEIEKLRDTFAAAALTGILSCFSERDSVMVGDVVESAYAFADAMIEAREGE